MNNESNNESNILKEVREKLILRRKVLNKTQTSVAEDATVSGALVHLFEGGSVPSISNLSKICGALGMRLVIGVEEIPETAPEEVEPESVTL